MPKANQGTQGSARVELLDDTTIDVPVQEVFTSLQEISKSQALNGALTQMRHDIDNGLPLWKTMERSGVASDQKLYEAFEEGYSFRSMLSKDRATAGLIPPSMQQMVIAGECSGSLPETLLSAGTIYEEKTDISTQNLEVILEPVLLIFVWIGVMGVAIAVILPIYSLVGGSGA